MKAHSFVAYLAFAILVSVSIDHARAQTQGEMNSAATRDFEKADAELNVVFKKVLALLDDEGKKKLIAAQRAWLAFRDAQATFDADVMRGGSAARGIYSASRGALTEERTAELKKLKKALEFEKANAARR